MGVSNRLFLRPDHSRPPRRSSDRRKTMTRSELAFLVRTLVVAPTAS
jgi:hypothetical protein